MHVSGLAGFAFRQRSYWSICGLHLLLMASTRPELRAGVRRLVWVSPPQPRGEGALARGASVQLALERVAVHEPGARMAVHARCIPLELWRGRKSDIRYAQAEEILAGGTRACRAVHLDLLERSLHGLAEKK